MKTKTIRKVHTYGGVATALFLILAGLTGTVLTFRGQLRQAPVKVSKALQNKPPLDKFEVVRAAESKMKLPAASVSFSSAIDKPHRIRFRDKVRTSLYYAPSGDFIEKRDRSKQSLVGLMFQLHTGSIVGRNGELAMALVGLILAVSSVTGLLLWPFLIKWNRRRKRLASREI